MGRPVSAPRNLPVRLALALFVAVSLTLYLMGGLVAKYVSTDTGGDAARAAGFTFNLADGTDSHAVDLQGIRKPGDSRTYTFGVVNGGEVSRRYTLSVELYGSMPLEVDVKDSSNESVISTTVAELDTAISSSGKLTKSSQPVSVGPNDGGVRAYTLTATWPEDGYKDPSFSNNAVGELVVKAVAEQVD